MKTADAKFDVEVSRDSDAGNPRAAYLRICKGNVAETKELAEGVIFADYDSTGRLLGIEVLSPIDRTLIRGLPSPEAAILDQFIASNVWPKEHDMSFSSEDGSGVE